MKRFAVGLVLLVVAVVGASAAEAQSAGPFKEGNKAIGTWNIVTKGKLSPWNDARTTTKATMTTKSIVNGWYLETADDRPDSGTSILTISPDGEIRMWLFALDNAITLTGKIDEQRGLTELSGMDQYGNAVELTDKWIDDDHRESRITVKSADATLIDAVTTLERVGK